MTMTDKRFGEYNQKRFITSIELDNSCGIEDLLKNKKYDNFRKKDYHKLTKIRDELNSLYYENEQLKTRLHEERELAMRLNRECDTLTIKKQELELEIIRLEEIIKTGNR